MKPWRVLAAIDLHGCERARLADPETIKRFVPAVITGAPSGLAERERVARDPGREAQRQAVPLGLVELHEPVEPLATHRDAAVVDVGPRVGSADRAAVELDAQLARRAAA